VLQLSESAQRLRPWIAPALGAGLVLAGLAMALGLSSEFAPMLGAVVAAAVLCIPEWIIPARRRRTGERAPDSAE
jgi:hypothetical protein